MSVDPELCWFEIRNTLGHFLDRQFSASAAVESAQQMADRIHHPVTVVAARHHFKGLPVPAFSTMPADWHQSKLWAATREQMTGVRQ